MMPENYDCITFHTSACDDHHDRLLNVHGPEGLDDVCPLCEITRLQAENERLREALQSIAKNTCCDRCQEAALVAKEALQD